MKPRETILFLRCFFPRVEIIAKALPRAASITTLTGWSGFQNWGWGNNPFFCFSHTR
jgi:hypothetical protein